jgi:hypothetical protein
MPSNIAQYLLAKVVNFNYNNVLAGLVYSFLILLIKIEVGMIIISIAIEIE